MCALATQLDFQDPQLRDIESCPMERKKSKMVELWFRHARDQLPSWAALVTALRSASVKESKLATHIKTKYVDGRFAMPEPESTGQPPAVPGQFYCVLIPDTAQLYYHHLDVVGDQPAGVDENVPMDVSGI